MIAVPLTNPDLLRRQPPGRPSGAMDQEGGRSGILADHGAATPFQPLDPGVVNQAIPAFFIGRNKDGFWVARDLKGEIGGIFLLRDSALAFAKRNSPQPGCATIFPSERFELDLENQGNPLAPELAFLVRLMVRLRRRIAALIRK